MVSEWNNSLEQLKEDAMICYLKALNSS
jgi:hypothetical protein